MNQDSKKTKELPPKLKLNLPLLHDRLRHVFKTSFTAIDIVESLLVFDLHKPAVEARIIMQGRHVEIAGISDQGQIIGYVIKRLLKTGTCRDHMLKINPEYVLDYVASYQEIIEILCRSEFCFVRFLGQVSGVIQKKDITKPSVRMWLFGLITMAEMILSSMLDYFYPDDTWQAELPEARLVRARSLQAERSRIGQDLQLRDCLYFVDKASILSKNPDTRAQLGFSTRKEAKQVISKIESLRNSLAHTHDIVTYDWIAILEVTRRLDGILYRF